MKVILGVLAVIASLPVLLLIGVALGPAALVLLFIGGFALLVTLANAVVTRDRG